MDVLREMLQFDLTRYMHEADADSASSQAKEKSFVITAGEAERPSLPLTMFHKVGECLRR